MSHLLMFFTLSCSSSSSLMFPLFLPSPYKCSFLSPFLFHFSLNIQFLIFVHFSYLASSPSKFPLHSLPSLSHYQFFSYFTPVHFSPYRFLSFFLLVSLSLASFFLFTSLSLFSLWQKIPTHFLTYFGHLDRSMKPYNVCIALTLKYLRFLIIQKMFPGSSSPVTSFLICGHQKCS